MTRGNRRTPGGNEFDADRPSWALTEKARSWVVLHTNRGQDDNGARQTRNTSAPAPALGAKAGPQWEWGDGVADGSAMGQGIKLTVADALILQSFSPDYPVRGTKTKQFEQVGNAVCPVLAAAILRQFIDGPR